MATTLTHLETVRRVLRGFSGPQPLAGTAQRAADAYAAMTAAEWTESDDGPAVPPHHCDRASPMPGDAYRQTWGYDKSTRTERSACGAVCYTVRLPADALGGEACGVASVSAKVFGDRYLECGAILTAILSEDAVPPAWGAILADGASTSAILVPAATDAHGDMIEPNKRADTSATATLPVGEPAAAWLHLVLRVADYLAVRDAWHEGGAMLDPDSIAVTFSRDVASDAPGDVALDIGRVGIGSGTGEVSAAYALQHLPRASIAVSYALTADETALAAEIDTTLPARVKELLAYLECAPALWAQTPMVAAAATVRYGRTGRVGFALRPNPGVAFCTFVAHGLTEGRTFRGLRLSSSLPCAGMPCRLMVYGVAEDIAIAADSALHTATPLPWWGDVLSRAFRRGRADSLRVMRNPEITSYAMPAAPESGTASVPVQPLAARSVSRDVSYIEFERPFASGRLSSVVLAIVPEGAATDTEPQPTSAQYEATVTREVSVVYQAQTTVTGNTADVSATGSMCFEVDADVMADVKRIVPQAGVTGDAWNSAIMRMPETEIRESVAHISQFGCEFVYDGKTYRYGYNRVSGDPAISTGYRATFFIYRPGSPTEDLVYSYSISRSDAPEFSFHAHAEDGSTILVRARIDNLITLIGSGSCDSGYNFGYVSPRMWNSLRDNHASNVSEMRVENLIKTRVSPGFAYAFAGWEQDNKIRATADVTQTGTISFVRDGILYSAPYDYSSSKQMGLTKTGTQVKTGNSLAEAATPYGEPHGFTLSLKFTGMDGSALWASVVVPQAGGLVGNVPYLASSANKGTPQKIGSVAAPGLTGEVTVVESGIGETIDPGLMYLVE